MSFRTFKGMSSGSQKVCVSVCDDKIRPVDGVYSYHRTHSVSYTKGHKMSKGNLFHKAKVIAPNIMSRW